MSAQFTDSVMGNVELIKELVAGLPSGARERCRKAGGRMVNEIDNMRKEYPNDPAVALGVAFAIFFCAERLIQPDGETKSDGDKLILTL